MSDVLLSSSEEVGGTGEGEEGAGEIVGPDVEGVERVEGARSEEDKRAEGVTRGMAEGVAGAVCEKETLFFAASDPRMALGFGAGFALGADAIGVDVGLDMDIGVDVDVDVDVVAVGVGLALGLGLGLDLGLVVEAVEESKEVEEGEDEEQVGVAGFDTFVAAGTANIQHTKLPSVECTAHNKMRHNKCNKIKQQSNNLQVFSFSSPAGLRGTASALAAAFSSPILCVRMVEVRGRSNR